MADRKKQAGPKIEDLPRAEQELAPEEAEQVQGGSLRFETIRAVKAPCDLRPGGFQDTCIAEWTVE